VATNPTVIGLEAEVVQQQKAVEQTMQEAKRDEELLKAKESQLNVAKYGVRAEQAVK
jgi:hypothetical protein